MQKPRLRAGGMAVALHVAALMSGGRVARAQVVDTALINRAMQSQQAPGNLSQQRIQNAIMQSGLTPEQLRAQLQSAGYNPALLDQYMAGLQGPGQSGLGLPGMADQRAQIDAVRALGLMPGTAADSLVSMLDSLRTNLQPELPDSLKRIFGLELFTRQNSLFRPNTGGPPPDSYVLGPGDELALILSGDVENIYSLTVARDGFIIIPTVGTVQVANLTLAQVRDLLYDRLHRVYSGVRRGPGATTHFEVTVTRMRTIQIFVAGEVAKPGVYDVSAGTTPLTALFAAGGPRPTGSLRRLEVRRSGRLVDSMDVYDFLLNGVDRTNQALQTGDVIFVPVRGGRVAVAGAVVRPKVFEIRPDETLRDVIGFAGGFGAEALRRRVQIHRILPPSPDDSSFGRGRIVVDVGPDQLAQGIPAVTMLPGDSVTVFPVAERLRGFVTIQGNVWVPGPVGFRPGMQLSDAIQMAGGPKPDVYLDQILVSRLRPDSTRIQLRSAFADSSGHVTLNLALQEEDEITVFSKTTFRPERYIIVSGAVRSPGRLRFREGMTVRDAILMADGLREDAYLKEAEIARVPDDRSHGAVSTTIRVPLDSTYLFARGQANEYPGMPGVPAPAGGTPEVPLQPYDNVLILRQPEWELPRTVKITGQVKYPGPYALRTKTERLADIIQRAGGLTREAYAGGITFVRQADSVGRVGIDLTKALENPKSLDNIILAAGDSIDIPEFDPVVVVAGAVNAPGAVAYQPGANLDYYVRAAGGYAFKGDKSRAWVEQPNGEKESVVRRFLLPDTSPEPRPGAEITVPERSPAQVSAPITSIIGAAAQVLASLITIIVVAKK
ncbi:MAG TPA: SLBB domain-containing protein [Gemmatimonadales bacterium]|nr:SLBB domain-containing protein [Gemmatimonadales bacterium]